MLEINDKFKSASFWHIAYNKAFLLNRDGYEVLNAFVNSSPNKAIEFIKDKISRMDRYDIIFTFKTLNEDDLNIVLEILEEDKLTQDELEEHEIKCSERQQVEEQEDEDMEI